MCRPFLIFILSAFFLLADPVKAAPRLESTARADECIFVYGPSEPNGPPNWGTFKPEWATCGTGTMQSPINVPSQVITDLFSKNPTVNLIETELFFEFTNPVNWELACEDVGACGTTTFMGTTYNFKNLHFHSPSEHKVNGVQFPLESHMVHESSTGELLVIATFFKFKSGDDDDDDNGNSGNNAVFASILANNAAGNERFDVDVDGLIGNKGYCMYSGSLTTPPCTEGVTWLLAIQTQAVSKSQVDEYVAGTGSGEFGNNRHIQPLNGRDITCFTRKNDDDDR